MSSKLGACPWSIETDLNNSMLMGADVFHQRSKESVASLVSLFGKNLTRKYSTFNV